MFAAHAFTIAFTTSPISDQFLVLEQTLLASSNRFIRGVQARVSAVPRRIAFSKEFGLWTKVSGSRNEGAVHVHIRPQL
jgi:hypothetical protein